MKKDKNAKIESEVEVEKGEEKEVKRKSGVEKRKKARRQDKVSRWGGAILFVVIVFVGFLLWVVGEVKDGQGVVEPQRAVPQGRVIIE